MSQLYWLQREKKAVHVQFFKGEIKPHEKTMFQYDIQIHQPHLLKQRERLLEIREKKTKHF